MILYFVMAGLGPAIHVFLAATPSRRGCPAHLREDAFSRFRPGMTSFELPGKSKHPCVLAKAAAIFSAGVAPIVRLSR
jgi:hypothetical protein